MLTRRGMIDLDQFKMDAAEEALLAELLREVNPRRIAEFGSGRTTRFWAENCDAEIVTWDNYPEWIAELRAAFLGAPWIGRVEFREYAVEPAGVRSVEKEPAPWDGPPFDFLFLDGPRSAHPQNFGRSGSFRFATRHAAKGAMIVWHDAQRPHERAMARKYLGHCHRRRRGSIGWCRWEPNRNLLPSQLLNRLNPFA